MRVYVLQRHGLDATTLGHADAQVDAGDIDRRAEAVLDGLSGAIIQYTCPHCYNLLRDVSGLAWSFKMNSSGAYVFGETQA